MRRECQEGPTSNKHRLFDSRRSRAAARNRQNSKVDGMSNQSQSPETTANTINKPTALFRAKIPKALFRAKVILIVSNQSLSFLRPSVDNGESDKDTMKN